MKKLIFVLTIIASFGSVQAKADAGLCTYQLYSTVTGSVLGQYQDADCDKASEYCQEAASSYPANPPNLNGPSVDCKTSAERINVGSATYRLFLKGQPVETFSSTRYNADNSPNFADADASKACATERQAHIDNTNDPEWIDWSFNSVCTSAV